MPFADIVGHRRLAALLSRAIARDTLPPALLLTGPRGVGKRRVADAMAQAFNCLTPASHGDLERDACGQCAACSRIARRVHPDVHVMEPDDKGNIPIDAVRDTLRRCEFRPFEGRRRVVIIDDADAMDTAPQSALLKTLEEPPSGSVFVLVSAMPDALLPTVRSRCPRLRFNGLSPAEVAEALVRDHGYDMATARAAGVVAEGSLGRALADQVVDTTQAVADARSLLALAVRGIDGPRRIQAVKEIFPKKSSPAGEREHLAARLRALSSLLRDVSLLLAGGSSAMLANADLESELSGYGQRLDADSVSRGYVAVDRALAALERNANAKVVADWLVLQL